MTQLAESFSRRVVLWYVECLPPTRVATRALYVPLGVILCSIRSLVSFPRLVVRVQALRALRYMTIDPLFVCHVTASHTALLLARYTPPTNLYTALPSVLTFLTTQIAGTRERGLAGAHSSLPGRVSYD